MKSLRRLFATATLTFVLIHAALADDGIIHGDRNPTPTPTPSGLSSPATGGVEVPDVGTTDGAGATTDASDTTVEIALSVLSAVLAFY
jgi:hypothetical protein